MAELEEFVRRRGQSTADALDDVLADYLEWERQDYQEVLEAVRQRLEDCAPGRPKNSSTSSRGSMDFRVELSEQAQRDITAIHGWVRSRQAGMPLSAGS